MSVLNRGLIRSFHNKRTSDCSSSHGDRRVDEARRRHIQGESIDFALLFVDEFENRLSFDC